MAAAARNSKAATSTSSKTTSEAREARNSDGRERGLGCCVSRHAALSSMSRLQLCLEV